MRRQNGLLHVTDKPATAGNFATMAAGGLSSSNFTSARRHRRLPLSDLKQAIILLGLTGKTGLRNLAAGEDVGNKPSEAGKPSGIPRE